MSSLVKEYAQKYIDRGWQIVPLAPGEKACKDADWQKIIFDADMFEDTDNIGIKSVNGLVVIDEDSPEVVVLADYFLPKTGAIYGRKAKPKSKRIYRSVFPKRIAYKDGPVVLIEIRVHHQDMAPPSVHPSGEKLEWHTEDDPDEIEPEILKRSVQCLASCALLVRHYPREGGRHDFILATSGELRRMGLDEKDATNIIKHAAITAGDQETKDRIRIVSDTFAKAESEAIQGTKELGDKEFVDSLHKIWGGQRSTLAEEYLNWMNERHAVLFLQSGGLVVVTPDIENGRPYLRFSSIASVRDLYPQLVPVSIKKNGEPIYKKLGSAWIDHPKRRFYKGLELRSKNPTEGYYNLWQGFRTEPKKGDWSLYQRHLREVIAAGSTEYEDWILDWMAAAVQNPEQHAHTAIALQGGPGVGKSTFCEWFGKLFGAHFLELSSYTELTGRFNAHLHNAILVFADEAIWPGDKKGLGTLRRMITQDTLNIERKGLDILTVPNHIHLMLASNEDWVVPAQKQERRFAVFKVSDIHQKDTKFFSAIEKQLFHEGGLAALLYDLLERKIKGNLRVIPETDALFEQKEYSADPFEKWWISELVNGDFFNDNFIEKPDVYDKYLEDMKAMGVRRERLAENAFWRHVKRFLPTGFPRSKRRNPNSGDKFGRKRAVLFPTLEESRKFFEEVMVFKIDWPQDDEDDEEQQDVPF